MTTMELETPSASAPTGAEERGLRDDEAYRPYCERVPYRRMPGVI